MERFVFALEQVLKVKKHRERLAELRQLQARTAFDAARARVDSLLSQLAQMSEALADPKRRTADPLPWLARWQHASTLGQQAEAAKADAHKAAETLAEAHRQYTKIATEVETLVSLRRQRWEEHKRQVARAEQERNDELGMRRWQAARRPPQES